MERATSGQTGLFQRELVVPAIRDSFVKLDPRTLVRTSALDGSGLLAPGSLYETEYRMLLPEGADLDALKAQAEERFRDTGIRWRDARNGAPGVARFVDRLFTN